ncbi:hypothetical protein [Actinoplanes sp. NBRC 101535]|uniref:hypothetical protein n=1 Tax=Actinoplanes sp. NBRC 101535 TaxID=3032196 RepID=UPI0025577A91|nr:hypothetical protein [Actinoplanes sp. NBRC 101535]
MVRREDHDPGRPAGGRTGPAEGVRAAPGPATPLGPPDLLSRPAGDRQWLLATLPALPILLLALRLWFLSQRDGPTMLLLLQYVSPLGLFTSLLGAVFWALPATLLIGRLLGLLLLASARPGEPPRMSAPLRLATRAPGWLVATAVLLAALTWQLRFLPILAMTALLGFALQERGRRPVLATILPLACAAALTVVFGPVAVRAWNTDPMLECRLTAVLLLLPPLVTPVLAGPVAAAFAGRVVRYLSATLMVLLPVFVAAVFIRVPVLPTIAVQILGPEPATVHGSVLDIDEQGMVLLDVQGRVRFISNDEVGARTLCPDSSHVVTTNLALDVWPVEYTALEQLLPRALTSDPC